MDTKWSIVTFGFHGEIGNKKKKQTTSAFLPLFVGLFHSYRPYRKAADFLSVTRFSRWKTVTTGMKVKRTSFRQIIMDSIYGPQRVITSHDFIHCRSYNFLVLSISAVGGGRKVWWGERESSGRNSVQSPRSAIRKSHLNYVGKRTKIWRKKKTSGSSDPFFSFLDRINTLTYTHTHRQLGWSNQQWVSINGVANSVQHIPHIDWICRICCSMQTCVWHLRCSAS